MNIFIGSQNIYDRDNNAVACELLYRNSMVNKYDEKVSSEAATYNIIKNITELGLDIITGGKIALINCNDNILMEDIITILPKEKVVIELLETIQPTNEIIKQIKKLNDFGYKLALDDVANLNSIIQFAPFISCIKVDYRLVSSAEKKIIVEFCKHLDIKLLAEKIENDEEYRDAMELGFDYFQGYYFSRPKIIQASDVEFKEISLYKLLAEISKEKLDLANIENIMKSDAALMYKFIKFTNSAYNGFIETVSDIRQSIMLIGEERFKKWILVCSYANLTGKDNTEYTNHTIVRAKFCELIMQKVKASKKNDAFISGLLLDINLLFGKEIAEILDEINMDNEIDSALRGRDGLIKDILDIAVYYSDMKEKEMNHLCSKVGIDKNILFDLYVQAVKWAKNL